MWLLTMNLAGSYSSLMTFPINPDGTFIANADETYCLKRARFY